MPTCCMVFAEAQTEGSGEESWYPLGVPSSRRWPAERAWKIMSCFKKIPPGCEKECAKHGMKFLLSQVDVVFDQNQVAYRNDLSTRGFQPHHCCSNGCANRLHLEVQAKEALVYSRSHWILEAKETSYHPIRAQWLRMHPRCQQHQFCRSCRGGRWGWKGTEVASDMPWIIRMSRIQLMWFGRIFIAEVQDWVIACNYIFLWEKTKNTGPNK